MSTGVILNPAYMAGKTLFEPVEISYQEDGELIVGAKLQCGFLRREIEQCMEGVPYNHAIAYAEKSDFVNAPTYAIAFASAVESLGNISVPERGEYIRLILAELTRISSHLLFLAKIAKSLNLNQVYNYCLREREKYCDLFELYCGSRLAFGAIKIGGVAEEATDGFLFKIEKTFIGTKEFLTELEEIFFLSPLLQNRLSGLATLKKEQALRCGITGPNARASGIFSDLREDAPYSVYKKIAAEKKTGVVYEGDVLARLRYRAVEIEESMGIIRGAIQKMTPGNYSIEISDSFSAPPGDTLFFLEGPRGQVGVFVSSQGSHHASCVRFSVPSLCALQMAPELLIGNHVDDLFLIINSLDPSYSEVDR